MTDKKFFVCNSVSYTKNVRFNYSNKAFNNFEGLVCDINRPN
jgi:hypothetical protein